MSTACPGRASRAQPAGGELCDLGLRSGIHFRLASAQPLDHQAVLSFTSSALHRHWITDDVLAQALRGRSIGFVFQQFHPLPHLDALDNVALPLHYDGLGGIPFVITPGGIALALGISTAVGVAAGLYPALKAARLAPVEALRTAQ